MRAFVKVGFHQILPSAQTLVPLSGAYAIILLIKKANYAMPCFKLAHVTAGITIFSIFESYAKI